MCCRPWRLLCETHCARVAHWCQDPFHRAQSADGRREGFCCIKAQLLLAQHTVEMDLSFQKEGPKAPYLHKQRRSVSLCQVCVLKTSPPEAPGRPDSRGEGIWEKIKQEDMAEFSLGTCDGVARQLQENEYGVPSARLSCT